MEGTAEYPSVVHELRTPLSRSSGRNARTQWSTPQRRIPCRTRQELRPVQLQACPSRGWVIVNMWGGGSSRARSFTGIPIIFVAPFCIHDTSVAHQQQSVQQSPETEKERRILERESVLRGEIKITRRLVLATLHSTNFFLSLDKSRPIVLWIRLQMRGEHRRLRAFVVVWFKTFLHMCGLPTFPPQCRLPVLPFAHTTDVLRLQFALLF